MSQRYLGGIITANPTTPTMTSESGVWTLEQQFQYNTTWSPKIVGDSVRLRSSASAYFNRTPASAGNRTVFSISAWIKAGSSDIRVIDAGDGTSSNTTRIVIANNSSLIIVNISGGSVNLEKVSTRVFRDPSAWGHLLVTFNSGTVKAYWNNEEITSWSTNTNTLGSSNTMVNAANAHYINRTSYTAVYGDFYITEFNLIDGQALTPSSFGAYDSTGTWQPLPYTGTYGTNGFYLTFADNSAATAAALGKDTSGNGNNWTPNNISLTAGTTYDWMLDSPTNWTSGTGNGVANYPVLNPLYKGYGGYTATPLTFSNANLSVTGNGSANNAAATMALPSSGKFYWEYVWTATAGGEMDGGIIGVAGLPYYYRNDGTYYNGSTYVSYGASYTTNDVIGVAIDMDNLTFTFYKNNVSQGVKTAAFPSGGTYFPWVYCSNTVGASINFGQQPFTYTPPSGYVALNTQNLPDPNITNGAQYMAATTYTGNGTSQSISNGGNNTIGTTFKPDLVWFKSRTNPATGFYNTLNDSVRGFTSGFANVLFSNTTDAEVTNNSTTGGGVSAFNSNGFSLANGSGGQAFGNANTYTYVAWQWQAGQGTTSSNTSGSITSTVSVNTTAGFSVVTYTGTGAVATVGHGLGVAPSMFVVKGRTTAGYNWIVYHASANASPGTGGLYLDTTSAFTSSIQFWNNTAPTSSVFSLYTNAANNESGKNFVAYCWAAVAGYSAFGSYTGNGSADGPFVYCGFRPRFVMVKCSSSDQGGNADWRIQDSSRDPSNLVGNLLFADVSLADSSGNTLMDFTSNGFKIRGTSTGQNANGATYIFMAFAENPFKIARAR